MTPSNPAPVGDEREAKERDAFERDAEPMGFDLTRHYCAAPEPWSQYKDIDTGNRWGGWLARADLVTTSDIVDSRKSGEPSDADIDAVAATNLGDYEEGQWHRLFARAILARFGTRPAAEPSQSGSAGEADEDIQRARKVLARLCDHGLVSMSIPVDHSRDEDMLLSRIIERAALSTPTTPEAEPVQQDTVTLRERIAELASQHGSMRAAARVMECNAGYLSRLCSGEKVDPGPTLLRRMGLREIVRYERIATPPAEKQAAPSGEDKTS